ncbi:MAG: TCP-1/cpn60 chaperonin family protein [Candidatus Marsarchaeota archaeon]|jgi:thermosome|nr:TCP-1/cpn60 chaperonin family protein [Candidatus Marsarchaeota archaeon]
MAENQLGGQQYLILPEGANRLIGKEAQRTNIAVGYAVSSIVRTTLGPKGMDKMLVSELGDIVITNDGATILEEMNVEHPVAKIMVEIAKTQDKEVGDGTTSAVIIAGDLLKNAGNLLDQGIPPASIIKGYEMARDRALEVLSSYSTNVNIDEEDKLLRVAMISMGSKNIGGDHTKKHLASLSLQAIKQVAEKTGNKVSIDRDFIKLEKKEGGSLEDTSFINGVLIDKEVAHPGMPKTVKNANIALLDVALEIEKTETDARIEITSPEQMQAFLEQEEKMLKGMVDKIAKSKANVVFVQKGIDDVAQHYLAKNSIVAVRRVKKSDMEKLAKATGARLVTSLDDLSDLDLGYAGLVEERKISGEQMIFVEKCRDPKSVTIFIRGGTKQMVDEVERALTDVMGALASTIEEGKYVTGGGSTEIEVALKLRDYATDVGGREQLAIQAFADSLEVVPKSLAESSGMDPIDTLVQLRSKHKGKEGKSYGIDVYKNTTADMDKQGIFEPLKVKEQALYSATDAAASILRIDDMISSKGRAGAGAGGMPPGGMGGME